MRKMTCQYGDKEFIGARGCVSVPIRRDQLAEGLNPNSDPG